MVVRIEIHSTLLARDMLQPYGPYDCCFCGYTGIKYCRFMASSLSLSFLIQTAARKNRMAEQSVIPTPIQLTMYDQSYLNVVLDSRAPSPGQLFTKTSNGQLGRLPSWTCDGRSLRASLPIFLMLVVFTPVPKSHGSTTQKTC